MLGSRQVQNLRVDQNVCLFSDCEPDHIKKIKDRHWKQPTIFEYYILGHVAFIGMLSVHTLD